MDSPSPEFCQELLARHLLLGVEQTEEQREASLTQLLALLAAPPGGAPARPEVQL